MTKTEKRAASKMLADALILMIGMGGVETLQKAGYSEREAGAIGFITPNEQKLIRPGLAQVIELTDETGKISRWASPFLLAGGLGFYFFRIYQAARAKNPPDPNAKSPLQQARERMANRQHPQNGRPQPGTVIEGQPFDPYSVFQSTPSAEPQAFNPG